MMCVCLYWINFAAHHSTPNKHRLISIVYFASGIKLQCSDVVD